MKATRIALLASIIFASISTSQASTVETVYVPSPALDNRQCAFYIVDGQWYAISQSDPNFDEQLAVVLMVKASGAQVTAYAGSAVCGLPRASLFVN